MFEHGQWATPVPVRANSLMPCVVELDAVGMPDVVPDPVELLGILRRRQAELLAAVGDVLVVLGEMGVQRHAIAARASAADSRIRSAAHRERRARRHHDAQHREPRFVVVGLDQALRVAQHRGLVLDEPIRRQAAFADADAHAAAARMEAHADLGRRLDLVVEAAPLG